jgi:cell division protein FtsB
VYRPKDQEHILSLRLQRRWSGAGSRARLSLLRRWFKWEKVPVVLAVVFLFYFAFGRQGVMDLWNFKDRQRRLDQTIAALMAQNSELEKKIRSLHHSDLEIERIARERMDMVRDNEMLFKFVKRSDL